MTELEKLKKEIRAKMDKPGLGARDHSTYTTTLLKIQQQLDTQSESKWLVKLRELKQASGAIEELQFGDPVLYKSIFENGKKKENLLMA